MKDDETVAFYEFDLLSLSIPDRFSGTSQDSRSDRFDCPRRQSIGYSHTSAQLLQNIIYGIRERML